MKQIRQLRLAAFSALMAATMTAGAQSYTYLTEDFEASAWTTKAADVTSSTGKWTTNKNIAETTKANSGSKSIHFASKDGLTTPRLEKGAGVLIYYANNANREVHVEKSTDGSQWTEIETYKTTEDWTRHIVPVNDADTRYIRLRTTSNKNFYVDDLLVTYLDGTDATGAEIVTTLNLPYFTQTFETQGQFPTSKDDAATEKTYNVAGQGEWKYLNAYRGTNASYIPDGSATGLRMLKNGSYVITPVLTQGVVGVMFDEGRTNKSVSVYTSTDEGATWTLARTFKTDTRNTVMIYERNVNRIKIANESTSDLDIDNITVTAYPSGTPATVTTATATDITASSAKVGGTVTDQGSSTVTETGVCWSTDGTPTVADNSVTGTGRSSFTVNLTGLPASTAIYYRAYAISLAGVAYGETLTFTTAGATAPKVTMGVLTTIDDLTDETTVAVKAIVKVTDNGGEAVTRAGVIFAPAAGGAATEVDALPTADGEYAATLRLAPSTAYVMRPFAINAIGRTDGDATDYTSPAIIVPEYPHHVYYCAPDGNDATADGSKEKPFFSLQKAADLVAAGDTIYMKGGTYAYTTRINLKAIGEKNSGRIALFSIDGTAVLDFKAMSVADANQGIRLTGSYWHIYGIDICNAGDNGMLIERDKPTGGSYADIAANSHQGHHNVVELCNFYRNADTGLQMKNLAEYNLVINCDSYFNIDPGEGNADGFAVKLSHGNGNYFYGCRAWRNSDDGWDQFIKKEGGFPDDITTTLENCWAFENGFLENGNPCSGNGNGFKMGSDQGRNNIIMNRCLAFDNLQKGFDQNHNTGHMILNNCTGYSAKYTDNKSHYTYRLDEPVAVDHEIRLTNCVAVSDGIADRNKSEYAPYSVTATLVNTDLNTLPDDYVSISTAGTDGPRDADGNLPDLDFMKIRPGNTKLIDAGVTVAPYNGESAHSVGILYNGTAPDLGCFETGGTLSGITAPAADFTTANAIAMEVTATRSGIVVITLPALAATDMSTAAVYDINGTLLTTVRFYGSTTSLNLRGHHGAAVIAVAAPAGKATAKVIM